MSALPDKLAAITAAVTVFSEATLPYALIGGLAVAVRSGIPRSTLDVDFAIPSYTDLATHSTLLATGFRAGRRIHA